MKNTVTKLCLRCWDMTKPMLLDKKKCSQCKKPYKYSNKEMKELENKVKEALKRLKKYDKKEPTVPQLEGHNWTEGGSDF